MRTMLVVNGAEPMRIALAYPALLSAHAAAAAPSPRRRASKQSGWRHRAVPGPGVPEAARPHTGAAR